MTSSLTLRIGGPFALQSDGPDITVSLRGQVLLAYLTLQPDGRATREELAALIWGDRADDQARASLRQELSQLRKALPEDTLRADRLAVQLNLGAVTLADPVPGAAFLDGLSLRGEAIEAWLRETRAADAERRVAAHLAEAAAHLDAGRADTSVVEARAAQSLDPYSETAVRLEMQAEAARGNRSAALAAHARFAARLRQDLDTDPEAETEALASQLRQATAAVPATAPHKEGRPTLAVMPFEDLSTQAQDMFADGVVEEITGALSRVDEFDVIARQSAFALKGERIDIPAAASRLGADYLVEGTVRRSGHRVRIAVQLVEGSDGHTLWAERFDDRMDDLFDLQDRIAAQVAGQVSPSLRLAEITRAKSRPPGDRTAYDLTLTALPHFWSLRREGNAHALTLLAEAIKRDPEFVPALALKAWVHAHQNTYMWSDDPAAERALALTLADRAAELAGESVPALVAIGGAYSQASDDRRLALIYIDRALHLDPNNAWAWIRRGWLHQYLGEVDASLTAFDRAERLSPLDPFLHQVTFGRAAAHYRWSDDPTNGLRMIEDGLRRHPGVVWPLRMMAVAHVRLGEMDKARAAAQRLLAHLPHVTIRYLKASLPPLAVHFDDGYYEHLALAGVPD